MAGAMPKIAGAPWPSEVTYISHNLYAPSVPAQVVKLLHPAPQAACRPRQSGKPNPGVRIRAIRDPRHPANGQCGLFAAHKLLPGQHIVDYCGLVLEVENESRSSDYILAFTEGLSIDGERFGNEGRFINDFRGIGERANAEFRVYRHEGGETRMGVFVGPKPIPKGEEILLSYGKGFWGARKS